MTEKIEIKRDLLDQCRSFIEERVGVTESAIKRAREGIENETKSSAGDKYETGRAMMHNETENHSRQLSEARKLELLLGRIKPEVLHDKATFGSVVKTDLGNYFIAISAGRLMVGEDKYFAISPQTPLGREFLQKGAGESGVFNEKPIRILEVF